MCGPSITGWRFAFCRAGCATKPQVKGVREDLGRGPRRVFGACVLLVCSPVQGECRWARTSRSVGRFRTAGSTVSP